MGRLIAQEDISKDNLNASPYIRVNRSAVLNLSTTWQTATFNGTSTFNQNSFPTMTNGSASVYLDSDQQTFRFNSGATRTYNLDLDYKVMGGTLTTQLQMRFVVPSPTPIYFPLPDGDGFANLATLALNEVYHNTYSRTLYSNPAAQQYGIQVQFRAVAISLTAPQLQELALFIYGA